MICNGYEYRYIAACGLERRLSYSNVWSRVTGEMLARMTSGELRHCADVMDTPTPPTTEDTP